MRGNCATFVLQSKRDMVHFRIAYTDFHSGNMRYFGKVFYYEHQAENWINENNIREKYGEVNIFKFAD